MALVHVAEWCLGPRPRLACAAMKFKRGPEAWVDLRFPKPIEVPMQFWVCVDFRAAQTKGVYVSIDDSTDGSHSRIGLPGGEARQANLGGDWMIEALLAK